MLLKKHAEQNWPHFCDCCTAFKIKLEMYYIRILKLLFKLTQGKIISAFLRTFFNIVCACNPWLILCAHVIPG